MYKPPFDLLTITASRLRIKNFHLPRFNYQITILNQLPQKVIKEEEQQTLKTIKLETRKRLDNLQTNRNHGVQSAGKTG